MAPRSYTLEIRTDHDKDDKDGVVLNLIRMAGKHALAQCLLLQDRRPPQISLQTSDMFEAAREINLADDIVTEADEPEGQKGEGAHSDTAHKARVAGYTVADKGTGWKFNDPDGKWSDLTLTTEQFAWEAAYADSLTKAA